MSKLNGIHRVILLAGLIFVGLLSISLLYGHSSEKIIWRLIVAAVALAGFLIGARLLRSQGQRQGHLSHEAAVDDSIDATSMPALGLARTLGLIGLSVLWIVLRGVSGPTRIPLYFLCSVAVALLTGLLWTHILSKHWQRGPPALERPRAPRILLSTT